MAESHDNLAEPAAAVPTAAQQSFDSEAYKAKKQKEREDIYSLLDNTTEQIQQSAALFQLYLNVQARFDRYSVNNAILITAQYPDATRLADYETWKAAGAFVTKGEKAISILEPSSFKREDGTVGTTYKVKKLFDVVQTNTAPIESNTATRDERTLLKALLSNAPCKLKVSDSMSERVDAIYRPEDKMILIRAGMDPLTIFRTASQELAHAHLDGDHYSRADCSFCAYYASYILCRRFGVPTDSYQFEEMPERYREMEVQAFRKELSSIREVANTISTNMNRVLEPTRHEKINRGGGAR